MSGELDSETTPKFLILDLAFDIPHYLLSFRQNFFSMATILYFGWARECAAADADELRFDEPLSQHDFWTQLLRLRPGLLQCQQSSRIAVNQQYLGNHDPVEPHSEIAIIPPVAGG